MFEDLQVTYLEKNNYIKMGQRFIYCRPYLAGSNGKDFPNILEYATHDDCDSFELSGEASQQSLGHSLSALVNSSLLDKGALLVRGLDKVIRSNTELSQARRIRKREKPYLALKGYRTFMYAWNKPS